MTSSRRPVVVAREFDPRDLPIIETPQPLPPAVPQQRLAPDAIRRRFAEPPSWEPEQISDRMRLRDGPPRPAAVLVPLVAHASEVTVLLTRRTLTLRSHSGQVAFPGGGREPGDTDPVHTALRETREEVGIDPDGVEVIGQLPEYLTGTGYQVTPIVGFVRSGLSLTPDPIEVAEVFEVPLAFLMDPRHHQQRRIEMPEGHRLFWAMPYRPVDSADEHFIWGATAAMLRNLYRLLAA